MVSAPSQPIRLVLVEDSEIIRVAVRTLLNDTRLFDVVGETPSAAVAIQNIHDWKPDVVLLDTYLLDGSGLDVCRAIQASCPSVRTLFFSAFCDMATVKAAIGGGALGYLEKSATISQLTEAIRAVAEGSSYFDGPAASMIVQLIQSSASQAALRPIERLSAQEDRVVACVTEGKTNKEIAALMGLSDKTVKNYLANVFDKLKVSRRSQVSAMYMRNRSRPPEEVHPPPQSSRF
jgi:two-component system, NarL family, response regulator DevR